MASLHFKNEINCDDNLSNKDDCYIIEVDHDVVSLSSDGSDVVVINEERSFAINKLDAGDKDSVMISSDNEFSDNFVDININIESDGSDGNVSDVNTGILVKWNEVGSPTGWTKTMKRYYNKPCKRQRYFDWRKVLEKIRLGPPSPWNIKDRDIYPFPTSRKRCLICRQADHLTKKCPRRNGKCTMCGDTGHLFLRCPRSMCLNCGVQRRDFIDYCGKCYTDKRIKCSHCERYGHESKNCPDIWRRFHRTTAFKEINSSSPPLNNNLQCCNCAQAGHLFEDCSEKYFSSYTPTSFLVTNYGDYISKNRNSSQSNYEECLPQTSSKNTLKRSVFTSDEEKSSKQRKLDYNERNNSRKRSKYFMAFSSDPLSFLQKATKRFKKKKKKKKKSSMENNHSQSAGE